MSPSLPGKCEGKAISFCLEAVRTEGPAAKRSDLGTVPLPQITRGCGEMQRSLVFLFPLRRAVNPDTMSALGV